MSSEGILGTEERLRSRVKTVLKQARAQRIGSLTWRKIGVRRTKEEETE